MLYTKENIKGKAITYYIERGAIHIVNDVELNNLLKDESVASILVAKMLLDKYNKQYGDFNASIGSIALEILVHAYPDRIAKKLLMIDLPNSIKNQLTKFLEHTDIIDIGETDIERWTLNQAGKLIDLFY